MSATTAEPKKKSKAPQLLTEIERQSPDLCGVRVVGIFHQFDQRNMWTLDELLAYGKTPSVIASSMAGKAVQRPAELVFVAVTLTPTLSQREREKLQRPSQYDRISVPCAVVGRTSDARSTGKMPVAPNDGTPTHSVGAAVPTTGEAVRYVYLGRTRGLWPFQIGDGTVAAMQEMLRLDNRGGSLG